MINRLENVTIDNTNEVFGGFIYSVNYTVGLAGELTTLKVSIISINGDYFISEEDLKTRGAPTEIKIGSAITFFGYPIEFRFEKGPSGKVLEVEYVDESIAYLDLKYVALNGRVTPPEDASALILLGRPFVTKYILGNALQLEITAANSNYIDIEDELNVPDILYTFPELISSIRDLIETMPTLTADHNVFYRPYTGTLREVLSSWCNDLGLSFYWQNRKLHFIDLRNPNTFEYIRTRVNEIIAAVKPESVDESISLRDTFSRANNSIFLKNGQLYGGSSETITRRIRFAPFKLNDIPQVKQYYGTTSLLTEPHVARMKAGKFGPEVILMSLARGAATDIFSYFPNTAKASIALRRLNPSATTGTDPTMYDFIRDEADDYFGSSLQYTMFIVYTQNNSQLSEDYAAAFQKYQALANYLDRFHYKKMSLREFQESSFNQPVEWFYDGAQFASTPLAKVLEPFSNVITNFNTLSLRGFIEGNSNDTTFGTFFGEDPQGISQGYAISTKEPTWEPQNLEELFNRADVFIYEPKSDTSSLVKGTFFLCVVGNNLDRLSLENIEEPDEEGHDVYSTTKRNAIILNSVDPRKEWVKTEYPENFSTANVARLEMNNISLPEEFIIAQGPIEGSAAGLTYPNFLLAHQRYTAPLNFSQDKPFFTKNFTLPTISPDITPKIEEGFVSLNISYGAQGLTATYNYGTYQMKLPNPDYYLASFYDNRARQSIPYLAPKIIINNRGANFIR